jgi:hypothetical protein
MPSEFTAKAQRTQRNYFQQTMQLAFAGKPAPTANSTTLRPLRLCGDFATGVDPVVLKQLNLHNCETRLPDRLQRHGRRAVMTDHLFHLNLTR